MHRQKSAESLRALRFASFHYLFNVLLALTGLGFLLVGLIVHHKEWIWIGAASMAAWVLSLVLFFAISFSWTCPLCMGRLWINTGCRRHRKAVRAFGISYRLQVALATMRGKAYRCPYCGEPFSTTKTRR